MNSSYKYRHKLQKGFRSYNKQYLLMGCCPLFRRSQKVVDVFPTLQQTVQPQIVLIKSNQKASECRQEAKESNPTEMQLQLPKNNHEIQSHLQISFLNESSNKDEQQRLQHLVEPRVIVLGQSKLRESLISRWESPEFKLQELFLVIDFDRLFKSQ